MSAPEGPYLYDDAPEPLHTGTPRRRGWLILAILAGTVVLAVASVVLLPLVKGSPATQSTQAVTVFLAALRQGDTETAYQLLCDAERVRVRPEQVATEYRAGPGTGHVVRSVGTTADGDPAQRVTVRWSDGETTRFTVINEGGPHICGISK